MPNVSGMDILKKLKEKKMYSAKVIIVKVSGQYRWPVEAMTSRRIQFLTKPYSAAELNEAVSVALKDDEQSAANKTILSHWIQRLMKNSKIQFRGRIAQTDSTVLITGLCGTGKELVARTVPN